MIKILIVEDDPLMSRMYERIFSFEKYDVVMAHDGEEGLAKIQSEHPTIVLLDVMMPKMNGMQVLEAVKANDQTKSIPVVMLTNLAGQQDAETALAKGAVKYIIKSEHDPKQVSEMVKEILAGYTRNEIPTATAVSAPQPTQVQTSATPVYQQAVTDDQQVQQLTPVQPVMSQSPIQQPVAAPIQTPQPVVSTPPQTTTPVSPQAPLPTD